MKENWNIKSTCESCGSCCKFEKAHAYFAPIFTKEEVEQLNLGNTFEKFFMPVKDGSVFQPKLVPAGEYVACPFLNQKNGLCEIYNFRPVDCRVWPMFVIKGKNEKPTLVCFEKDEDCNLLKNMSDKEYDLFVKKLEKWFDEEKLAEIYKKYPAAVWDYTDTDIFIIKEI